MAVTARLNSSYEERLFQIYKELVATAVVVAQKTDRTFPTIESVSITALQDAKKIMQVFNERNVNETENE